MKKSAARSVLAVLLVALLCGGLSAGSERKISRVKSFNKQADDFFGAVDIGQRDD